MINHRFSVAPMLDWTDRHCRFFHRLMSKHAILYTEMIHMNAVLRGKREEILAYHPTELPLALQLGGDNPQTLALAAKIAEDLGYSEININVGCPSERVQKGRFGACLMKEPDIVAEIVSSVKSSVSIPVTVKHRIGVDDIDQFEALENFVRTVSLAGCKVFIIHARKAWLKGLSPKENREIPPLRYDLVYNIKSLFPNLTIVINGGITTIESIKNHLEFVDGAMLGRAVYKNPYLLSEIDSQLFEDNNRILTREEIIYKIIEYIKEGNLANKPISSISRHILGLFYGTTGANIWKRFITENANKKNATADIIATALNNVLKKHI